MGADKGTLVTLDTVVRDPLRYVNGDTAFLVLGGSGGHYAVRCKGADWEQVALQGLNRPDHIRYESGYRFGCGSSCVSSFSPALWVIDFDQIGLSAVNRSKVHVNYLFTAVAVRSDNSFFNVLHSVLCGDDVSNPEESALQHGVDPAAQTKFAGDFHSVDVIEAQFLLGNGPLEGRGQFGLHFLYSPRRVEEEDAAFFNAFQQVVAGYVRRIMAGNQIGMVYQIGCLNRRISKAEVGDGNPA